MLNETIKILFSDIKNLLVYKKTDSYKSAVIIIISAAILLVSYNILIFMRDYRNINVETIKKAHSVSTLGELALAEPLWNLDDEVVDKIANSLFTDIDVSSVKINSSNGTTLFEKNNNHEVFGKPKYLKFSTADIIKKDTVENGYYIKEQKIGNIQIGVTKYFKQRQVIKTFIVNQIIIIITLYLTYLAVMAILSYEKNNKERLKTILNNMVDGVITTDKNLVIKTCNQAAEKMLGLSALELIQKKFDKFILLESEEIFEPEKLLEYCKNFNMNFFAKKSDGSVFPVEFNAGTIFIGKELTFVITIRDITIRKEVDKMKNEFLSTINHELRTPLTAIKGSLSLLKNQTCGQISENHLKLTAIADNNCTKLINVITDLLDIEKIASGNLTLNIEDNDIIKVINECIECNIPYASPHNINLKFEDNGFQEIYLNFDKQKISQVLSNLVSNAIKFSNNGDTVTLSVEKNNNNVKISVKDTGIGIPEEYKEKIFDKFVQVDASDTKEKGGTGLGLSICKSIIEKHQGLISLESEVGKGSVFYFELPI